MRYPASDKLEIIRRVEQSPAGEAGHWKISASHELLSIAGTIFIATLDPKP
jgi:hypothetical protein